MFNIGGDDSNSNSWTGAAAAAMLFSCGRGDNDAGKDDDRCFIAGDGANSCHLRCIMALLFQVKKKQAFQPTV